MRGLPQARWVGGAAVLALALAACGGSSSGSTPSSSSTPSGSSSSSASAPAASSGSSDAELQLGSCKPEHSLIPADTNESCGGRLIDALFTGLVTYDPKTAKPLNAVAEDISSTDNTVWTIKIKSGYKFSDGTPVDAQSFVDAWNWSAFGGNNMQNAYFFGIIDGFSDVQGDGDANGDGKISGAEITTDKTMKGLKVDSPTQFTVTLSSPNSVFPVIVGYTAFSPLPKSFFTDPTAFGKKPVGDGPFVFASGNGDDGYHVTAAADYTGPDKPKITKVFFKTYQSPDANYADILANNADWIEQVPPSVLQGKKYQQDVGEGHFVDQAVGIIQTLDLPIYQKNYSSPDLAKAIALSIDRKTITDKIFAGGRKPASGWVSPVVNGYKAGACGEFCDYDPAKAKTYLQKAGGFSGTLGFAYNADGAGNKETAEATCNSIQSAIGVKCIAKAYVDFSTLRKDVNGRKMTTMFRAGWQMDYPSIENFLVPLYTTKASSNDTDFTDKQFDDLTKQAAAAGTVDEANSLYQQAEARLALNMTSIPLWYSQEQSAWSSKLSNVIINQFGELDLASVTIK